jgi:hypothetical protein
MLSERFELRFSVDLLRQIDDWRRQQPDLPTRAEAIRRLIERSLVTAGRDHIAVRRHEPAVGELGARPRARKPRVSRGDERQ